MADNARGRNGNWTNSYQDDTVDMRERDQDFENTPGGVRRVKFGQELYRPGSGPLRKSEESNCGGRRADVSYSDSHSMEDSRNSIGKGNFGNCTQFTAGVRKPSIPIYQPPRGKKGPGDSISESSNRRDYGGFSSGPRSIQGDSRESTPSRGDIPSGPPFSTRSLGRPSGRGGRESREQTPSTDVNSHDEGNGSIYSDSGRRKSKKPEQARYIPKGRVSNTQDGRDHTNGGEASEVEHSSLDMHRESSPRRDFGGPKHSADQRESSRSKRNDRGRRRSEVSDHRGDDVGGRGRGAGDGGMARSEDHHGHHDGDSNVHEIACHNEVHPRDVRKSKRSSGNRNRNFNNDGDNRGREDLIGDRRNRSPAEERRHIPSLVDLRPIPDPLTSPPIMRNGGRDGGYMFGGGDYGDYNRDDDLDERGSVSHGGRVRAKPPSGRRGSGASIGSIGGQTGGGGGGGGMGPGRGGRPPPSVESLPPRLRKKLLGIDAGGDAEGQAGGGGGSSNSGGGRRQYDSGGEDWDGSSVTFQPQWSSSRRRQPPNPPPSNSGALGASRGRGRGRRGRDGGDGRVGGDGLGSASSHPPPRYSRSLTPDRLSEVSSNTVCRYPGDVISGSMGGGGRRPSWRTPPPSPRSVTPSGEHSRYRRRSGSNPWDGMASEERRSCHVEHVRPKLLDLDNKPKSLGQPTQELLRPFSPVSAVVAPPLGQHNRDWRSKETPPISLPHKNTTHMDWTVDPDDDDEVREEEDDRTNDVTSDSGMASLPRDKRSSAGNGQGRHTISERGTAGGEREEGRKSGKGGKRRRKRKGEGRAEEGGGEHPRRSLSRDQGRRREPEEKGMRNKSKEREKERNKERDNRGRGGGGGGGGGKQRGEKERVKDRERETRGVMSWREVDRTTDIAKENKMERVDRGRLERGRMMDKDGDKERARERDLDHQRERERYEEGEVGGRGSESGPHLREDDWEVGHGPQRGGILILPPNSTSPSPSPRPLSMHYSNRHPPNIPSRHPMHQEPPPHLLNDARMYCSQRVLFDPNDPGHPILVPSGAGRVGGSMGLHPALRNIPLIPMSTPMGMMNPLGLGYSGDYLRSMEQHGTDLPSWYDPYSDSFRSAHYPIFLMEIQRADAELRMILSNGLIIDQWEHVTKLRKHLQWCLQKLLADDIKFCEAENVESHVWKVAFYSIVDPLRKEISARVPSPSDPTPSDASEDGQRERRERVARNKEFLRKTVLGVIEEWTEYLEELLTFLQSTYKFSLEAWLDPSSGHPPPKGLGFLGLALISAQKILIFLGDLARYKEQINETTNYGKARQWYLKAQLVNPKNGRPYNQLAILAIYARRKLDAVYYYMRSLMASNPFHSARESLLALFDETRKKFEQTERKRREEHAARERERRASRGSGDAGDDQAEGCNRNRWGLRREVWVRPDAGGRCKVLFSSMHRNETAPPEGDDEERELGHLSSVEVNKRFVTSYLHVQGKLFTKIGMETFQEAGLEMLREFRTLLLHSPLPLNSNRLLQLLALNMFAIENTQLRDRDSDCGTGVGGGAEGVYRSAVQESALVVSLQMFNLLLERCVALLRDLCHTTQLESNPVQPQQQPSSPTSSSSAPSDSARGTSLATSTSSVSSSVEPTPDPSPQPTPALQLLGGNEDLQTLLPAIKVWCDWLLCHSAVWNPPPSCTDYSIGPPGDAWSRLAELVSLLGRLQHGCAEVSEVPGEGLEPVRLPEDSTLSGFTPLMANAQEPGYAPADSDMELAQVCLRIQKLLFFGTEFLCGLDPPVLKLHVVGERGESEYVSVVSSCPTSSAPSPTNGSGQNDADVLESFSEEEEEEEEEDEEVDKKKREEDCVRKKTDWADVDDDDEDEIRNLLSRKEELEKRHISQERHQLKVSAILAEQRWTVSGVEVEVRPRLLVPDTNCFIDHLPALRRLIALPSPTTRVPLYTLMVPIIVVSELEGLARGGQRPVHPAATSTAVVPSPSHCVLVAEGARSALALLRNPGGPVPGVRCVTTRGTVLSSTTFTVEEDDQVIGGECELRGNDDRILSTCLSLVRVQESRYDPSTDRGSLSTSSWRQKGTQAARHVYREVVLLTEDRNLRVKALARDVPVRGVEWFLNWATKPNRASTRSSSSSSKCPSPPSCSSQRGIPSSSIVPPPPLPNPGSSSAT